MEPKLFCNDVLNQLANEKDKSNLESDKRKLVHVF